MPAKKIVESRNPRPANQPGRKRFYADRVTDRIVGLTDAHAEILRRLGDGNLSAGARLAAELVDALGVTAYSAAEIDADRGQRDVRMLAGDTPPKVITIGTDQHIP